MKLRLQSNSIRLRLKRGEVEQLAKTGCVEESIIFGLAAGGTLTYTLQSFAEVSSLSAQLESNRLLVQVPPAMASRWATSDEVAMETTVTLDEGRELHILVEKDFACLTGPEEENVDTFPNPLAGTTC